MAKPGARTTKTAKQSPSLLAIASQVSRVVEQLRSPATGLMIDIGGSAIALTNLERVYWPAEAGFNQAAITKRDFIRYLVQVSPLMLPHIAERPLTLFRWPGGINAKRMLVKHWQGEIPNYVQRVQILSETKGIQDEYLLCNNLATLVWLAQHGTLEMHVWHSRVTLGLDTSIKSTDFASSTKKLQESVIEYPDYVLFDIDPYIYSGKELPGKEPEPNSAAFAHGKRVAFWLKDVLDGMRLKSFVKTTGKTGLHVIVPIRRELNYVAVREIARTIGEHLLREHPNEITTEWATEKRRGKTFIDFNMNVRGKSTIAPYCPRGLPGAPLSTPLTWIELNNTQDPFEFRIPTVLVKPQRADRWNNMLGQKQDLSKILTGSKG